MNVDEKLVEFARSDFTAYCALVSKPQYIRGKPHKIIISQIERALKEDDLRIILNAPPRHGKTHTTAVLFIAFYLSRFPDREVIYTTYAQSLSSAVGTKVRNIIASHEHRNIFPEIELAQDSKANHRFGIKNNIGGFVAVGRGGSITGKGANLIIIDDLLKGEIEARSRKLRDDLKEWYKNTLYTRLMSGGSIISIGTRWHEDDLNGYLLRAGDEKETDDDLTDVFELIKLQAIDDEGNALWEEKFPIRKLLRIKKNMGSKNFEALYQQNPSMEEGEIIKLENVKKYSSSTINEFEKMVQSWDLAFKGDKTSDFVVGQLWGKKGADYYMIDQFRERADFPKTIKKFKDWNEKYGASTLKLVEDKANGSALYSTLKNEVSGIKMIKPIGDKVLRLNAVSGLFEGGNVFINEKFYDEFLMEILPFPNGKNDDQVDACTQALEYLSKKSHGFYSF